MPSQTIGATPVLVVAASAGRKTITFSNNSTGSQVLYLDNTEPTGLTIANAGYPVFPGEKLVLIHFFDGEDMRLPWSAVADAPGAILYVKETHERYQASREVQ